MSTSRARLRIRQRFSPSSSGLRMTPEEFDAMTRYDDRYRYELVHGVLVVTPAPDIAERDPNGELEFLLRFYKKYHPQGSALDKTVAEHDLWPGKDRRRADRVIWAGLGRVPNLTKDVPTIAVEFVSVGKRDWLRDYEEKRREYLAMGVSEYWVIDRFRRTMTVYRNPPRGPAEQVIVEAGVYRTDLLPGFELPLAQLLAEADDWPKKERKRKRK
jgi:Uma2 family endonuclease